MSGSPEIAKILCSKGIDVNRVDEQGRMGPYYLIESESKEKIEVFKILLNHGLKINFHLPGKNTILGGQLTLLTSLYDPPIELIEFLLDNGADPNALIYTGVRSPLTCIEFIKQKNR